MIDFRYHLVSIVAVFLALGLGLVLGSTALQPTVLSGLKKTSSLEQAKINQLYADQKQLKDELSASQQFAQAAEPQLLRGLLSGQRVVIVEAPGAPGQVTSGIARALRDAGASISGHVHLQPMFLNAASSTQQQQLGQLAQQLAPPGMAVQAGTGQAQASQVLASALLTRDGPGQPVPGQPDPTAAAVLNGFGAGGLLSVSGQPDSLATLAVVVIPGSPPSTNASNAASQALVTLAQQLNRAGRGTVVAGSVSGSGQGSAIDVMWSDGRSGHMSSVDDADTVIGQIVVAQALAGLLRGVSGNFGSASNASAPGPSPAPTPSPSASPGATSAVTPSPQVSPGATATGKP